MPLTQEQLQQLSKSGLMIKIICGALLASVCTFVLILFMIVDFDELNTDLDMLVLLAASSGAVMFSLSFVAFKVLSAQTAAKDESLMAHFQVLQTAWIVRFAIIEGAIFMNLIVTMAENSLITMFVAVFGVLLMLIGFPRSEKVENLMEYRLRG